MPLISLSIAHHQTLDEARRRLEMAVHEVSERFGVVRRIEWSSDRTRVKLEAVGARVEMWVDERDVHAIGDIPIVSELLGGPLTSRLKEILQQTFRKPLPRG